jgi:hypothetical protein
VAQFPKFRKATFMNVEDRKVAFLNPRAGSPPSAAVHEVIDWLAIGWRQ